MEGARVDWIILTIILKLGYHGCISVSYDIYLNLSTHMLLTLHSCNVSELSTLKCDPETSH